MISTASPACACARASESSASWCPRSRAAVGSSSSSMPVRPAITRANAVRALSPPDRVGTARSARWAMSAAEIASATASSSSADLGVRRHGARPIRTTSCTANGNAVPFSCSSTPRRRDRSPRLQAVSGRSSTSTSPASGRTSPASTPSRVDLPAPLGPSTASTSPACRARSTPSSSALPPRTTCTARSSQTVVALMPSLPRIAGCGAATRRRTDRRSAKSGCPGADRPSARSCALRGPQE